MTTMNWTPLTCYLDVCQPAVSAQVVWVYLAFNVITDLYLLSIPLRMLWAAALKPLKKAGLMVLFGGGVLVIACATLRCVLIITVSFSIVSIFMVEQH